ncbi:hypothetical protein ACEN9J_03040 [Variovorax sp. Varisp41]|uniref:hypothetical protein n=1 Tax=Variovorax sp. Varisp41 TaxID=3243033 RepID=UPI0039B5D8DC
MTDRWMEYDCPQCGIDYDVEPAPNSTDPTHVCACGFTLTPEVLRVATFYEDSAEPRCVENPFR